MESIYRPLSLTERRASIANDDESSPTRNALTVNTANTRMSARLDKVTQCRPHGPLTPNMATPDADDIDEEFAPQRPPTPVASPGPDVMRPDWSGAGDQEDLFLSRVRRYFKDRSGPERTRILADLLNLCTSSQLSFVHQYVSPLLKKDPFTTLPSELCLRVSVLPLRDHHNTDTASRSYLLSMTPKLWFAHHKFRNDGENYSMTM